ncbi:MAG: hypothetical protein ABR548_12375 [Actinomycetota bacterium]
MKKLFLVLAVLTAAFAPQTGSTADQTVIASGNATLSFSVSGQPVTCTGTMFFTFVQRGANFVASESWGPTTGTTPACSADSLTFIDVASNAYPSVRQCLPNGLGGLVSQPYVETVSGSTYTLKATYVLCTAPTEVDAFTFTLGSSTIAYSHKYTSGTTIRTSVTGTLTRAPVSA